MPAKVDAHLVGMRAGLDRELVGPEVPRERLVESHHRGLEVPGLVVHRDDAAVDLEAAETDGHRPAGGVGRRRGRGVLLGDVPVGRAVLQLHQREPRVIQLDRPHHDRRRAPQGAAHRAGEIDHHAETPDRRQGIALELADPDHGEAVEAEGEVGEVAEQAEPGVPPVHLRVQRSVRFGLDPFRDPAAEQDGHQDEEQEQQGENAPEYDQRLSHGSCHGRGPPQP